ncbi:MAG: type II toxin-antitoxin system prevent-host-death family antitoxin [Pseudomonadota bacterium]
MRHVDIQQAEEHFRELVELAAAGEEVIISKEDRPLARLTPIVERKRNRRFGSAKGLIAFTEDFNEPIEDIKAYM